jgi:hypothetical protein
MRERNVGGDRRAAVLAAERVTGQVVRLARAAAARAPRSRAANRRRRRPVATHRRQLRGGLPNRVIALNLRYLLRNLINFSSEFSMLSSLR